MIDSSSPWIAEEKDFSLENKMYRSLDMDQLIQRYKSNQKILIELVEDIKLNKSLQMEYFQNHWIQSYSVENRLILIEIERRVENGRMG